ncbi:hypothetical protein [Bradyrhizobium yuanmingense]|uniref:hypothetical protein n=1 Tax=Bradyrhizobium yuanmingense TaxID=108015 RepID=UPI001FD8F830|nr:hypothetical protein [Bradyrhizobium yuanmingense]
MVAVAASSAAGTCGTLAISALQPLSSHSRETWTALIPAARYRYVYPLSERDLSDQVYYFEDSEDNDVDGHFTVRDAHRRPGLNAVAKGIDAWLKAWRGPTLSMLSKQDNGDEIIVEDTRAIAVEREHRVRGLEREILLAADEGSPETRLRERPGVANVMQGEIEAAIADMIARKLIVRLDARLVGLALWHPYTPILPVTAFPGGYLDRRSTPAPPARRKMRCALRKATPVACLFAWRSRQSCRPVRPRR